MNFASCATFVVTMVNEIQLYIQMVSGVSPFNVLKSLFVCVWGGGGGVGRGAVEGQDCVRP